MELKTYFAQDDEGNYLPGATCYLYMRGTESLIEGLRNVTGAPMGNPFSSDNTGRISFIVPNGIYDLRVVKGARDYRISVQSNDVSEDVAAALASAVRAETARDAALLRAGYKESIQEGLETTSNGEYFSVASSTADQVLVFYQNQSGTAAERGGYPSLEALKEVLNDPQRPRAQSVVGMKEEWLAGFTDNDGNETWLGARRQDGGPTEWALKLLRQALGTLLGSYPGMLMAVADSNGNLTDLAVRDSDGQVPDWVIERWAVRLVPLLIPLLGLQEPKLLDYYLPDVRGTNSAVLGSDSYVHNGEVLPVLPNMQQWAGWGSSTIAQFSEMSALAAEFGASYYNGGQGSEWSTHIAARLGSIPARLTVPSGSIPAEAGYALPVTCNNVQAASYFRNTDGYLSGVKGTLKATDSGFTFTRWTTGAVVAVASEQPFIPVDGPLHRADVTFLNPGKNDIQSNQPAEDVIRRTDASYEWLSPLVKRVIVIGQFVNTNTPAGGVVATRLAAINQHLAARYGRQFFDLGGYLTSAQIWIDTGVTPTATDLAQQAIGNIPPSLAAADGAHMLPVARAAVALKLKALVISLGWY